MKRKYIFTAILLALLTAAGAGIVSLSGGEGRGEDGTEGAVSKVVASFYPVYVAAENVIKDVEGVELTSLTEPKTGCLHDYQLTPQDMISLSDADLFLVNGGGIESFLDDVISSYPDLTVAEASEGISFLENANEDTNLAQEEEGGHAHDHDHGDVNAHVWMDVGRYEQYVQNIADALSSMDPSHREDYQENAEVYLGKLDALKAEIETFKGKCGGKKSILFHDAFAYFADMAGIEISYIIDMDENTSLSANEVSKIVKLVNSENIDLLFTEEQYGTKLADAVSRETGACVYVLDSLVSGDGGTDSYLRGMEKNLETLRKAFEMDSEDETEEQEESGEGDAK